MAPNTTPDTKATAVRTPAMPAIERLEYGLPRPPGETSSRADAGPAVLPAFQSVASGHFGSPASSGTLLSEESESATQTGKEAQWAQLAAELEARLAKENMEARQAISAARDEGRREGRHAGEVALNEDRQKIQARITTAVEAFRIERQKYFKDVEREVVRLSLAIASRVLHREAQMDPLFLAGAVHVALDKLADSSGVVLRVAPAQVLVWQEMFRLSENANEQPEILGDLSLSSGECVLETRLGTIEVGVRAQLEEIEKGFFDLLDHGPASPTSAAKRTV